VAIVLRIQLERQQVPLFSSLREYALLYGVNTERLKKAKKDILIMHPGPINRGVEIDSAVADGPHSIILNQVENGVAIRMACLYLLAGKTESLG
jgi:aspartate carbamoyltransferase catalytic subunit